MPPYRRRMFPYWNLRKIANILKRLFGVNSAVSKARQANRQILNHSRLAPHR
jgi:hypothetical protein